MLAAGVLDAVCAAVVEGARGRVTGVTDVREGESVGDNAFDGEENTGAGTGLVLGRGLLLGESPSDRDAGDRVCIALGVTRLGVTSGSVFFSGVLAFSPLAGRISTTSSGS